MLFIKDNYYFNNAGLCHAYIEINVIRDEIFIKMLPEEYLYILYIVTENQLKNIPKKA